jgi:hypothetical protein
MFVNKIWLNFTGGPELVPRYQIGPGTMKTQFRNTKLVFSVPIRSKADPRAQKYRCDMSSWIGRYSSLPVSCYLGNMQKPSYYSYGLSPVSYLTISLISLCLFSLPSSFVQADLGPCPQVQTYSHYFIHKVVIQFISKDNKTYLAIMQLHCCLTQSSWNWHHQAYSFWAAHILHHIIRCWADF